jgi:hypothetical protein
VGEVVSVVGAKSVNMIFHQEIVRMHALHFARENKAVPPALLSHRGLRLGAFGMPATYLGLRVGSLKLV